MFNHVCLVRGQKEYSVRGQNKSEALVRRAICDVTKGLITKVVTTKIRPRSDSREIKGSEMSVTLHFPVGKH